MTGTQDKPRRGKLRRVLTYISLTIAIGPPITNFVLTRLAQYRLDKTLATLHAKGEPITAAELKTDAIIDQKNASLDYKHAGEAIDQNKPSWKEFDNATADQFRLPLSQANLKTIRCIVSENAVAISFVASARKRAPGRWNEDLDRLTIATQSDLDLKPARRLCNLLRLAALLAHADGNDSLAIQYLNDGIHVADAAEHRPTLIAHLVALGANSLACYSVSELAPEFHVGANGLERDQLTHLQAELENEEPINSGLHLSWRSERILNLNSFQSLNFGGFLKPILLNDQACLCDDLQDVMIASEAPDWPTAKARLPTDVLISANAHPYYHLFLGLMMPGVDKAVRQDYHAKADRRLAATALAIRLYASDHDQRLPRSMTDLVPDYLPAIPMDPLSGQPLKYNTDTPRIYSVGDDGIDDGGIPLDPDSNNSYHRHHGDIVVYLTMQQHPK